MMKKKATIFLGLKFGDEGKGQTVYNYCRETGIKYVVRYNGGPQCAHNVITKEGLQHTFSSFGSGSLIPETKTIISEYTMIDPVAFLNENSVLSEKIKTDAAKNVYVSNMSPIITPYHVAVNRIKEKSLNHGSVGKGIGELAFDMEESIFSANVLYVSELMEYKNNKDKFINRMRVIQQNQLAKVNEYITDEIKLTSDYRLLTEDNYEYYIDIYNMFLERVGRILDFDEFDQTIKNNDLIFEGAQGVALDEQYGFHPHTTWANTTQGNALNILEIAEFDGEINTIGITRAHSTRHGNGPFVSRNGMLDDYKWEIKGELNSYGPYQKEFKIGPLDGVLLRYTSRIVNNISHMSSVVLTHLDNFSVIPYYIDEYMMHTEKLNKSNRNRIISRSKGKHTKIIRNIVPGNTLEEQTELTGLLYNCYGIVSGFKKTEELVKYVEKTTRTPVISQYPEL